MIFIQQIVFHSVISSLRFLFYILYVLCLLYTVYIDIDIVSM